ncbi:MAG: RNA polymerase sigma factor [Planctomycetes bacterium]|nr:RNA polymerase sigma factor [Planctomycetota bacterium]
MATTKSRQFLQTLVRGMAAEAFVGQSDRELVARFLACHDEAVFEAFVRRHGPMVYRVCWRVLQHSQDAEDAFQATFLLLAKKLRSVRKRESLASWLHGVAHRVALKARSQAANRSAHERNGRAANSILPEDVTWRELSTALDAGLAHLPEKWRLPLIHCYLEGRTQDEAAAQLGWSKSTLLRRLDEARAALGRRLTRKGIVWPAAVSALLLSDCVAPAALSSKLIGVTAEAAVYVATGKSALAIGLTSAKAVALMEGALQVMFFAKIKMAAIVVLALGLISGLATSAVPISANQEPAPSRVAQNSTKQESGKQTEKPKKPKARFTISKETTRVTDAPDPDGYIDYEAILNERLREGVTAENNANVLLFQAIGPHPQKVNMPGTYFHLMGILAPPDKGDYFVDVLTHHRNVLNPELTNDKIKEIKDRLERAASRPWKAKKYPHLAGWLTANERQLALATQAAQRSRYYSPMVTKKGEVPPPGLVSALRPGVYSCTELIQALIARAMLHLGEGRADAAWKDLAACHRLGRHLATGPTLLEGVVGVTLETAAMDAYLVPNQA